MLLCLYFQAEIAKAYRKLARKYHPDRYKVYVKTFIINLNMSQGVINTILCMSETWWVLIKFLFQYLNFNFFEFIFSLVNK